MISDSIFTTHHFKIPVTKLNETINLIPWGDVHRFAPLCDVEKWLEFCEWSRTKKNTYFIGMGDYDDLASTTERRALLTACFHDSTQISIDELFTTRTKQLLKEVEFMKGKLVGLVEGNHHGVLQSGMTTTQMMCDRLQCKYLGVSSFIRLAFTYGKKTDCIDMWAHHGRGASRLIGGSLNCVEQMVNSADADIYLMGHDHRKSVALKTKLCLGHTGELKQKKILLARTGAFLKGYVPEQPSYIAHAAMGPTDLGTIKIEFTPKRLQEKGKDDFYVDIHASL